MARVADIFPAFSRGEVSPLMKGRLDIEQYKYCLEFARNVWIRPYGVVSRLPGTEMIYSTKGMGYAVLLDFLFSAKDAYIIECGAGYFRFYHNGGIVLDDEGVVYELENDFTQGQLDSIVQVQLDDIIKLAYLADNEGNNNNRQKELIRKASNKWEFRDVVFKETPYLDLNKTDTTISSSGTTGTVTLTASTAIFKEGHIGANWRLGGTTVQDNKDVQGFVKITEFISGTSVRAQVQSPLSSGSATKNWHEGAWSDVRGYPSLIALFDGRLYYARTPNNPRTIDGSKPFAYEVFTPAVNNEDDGAVRITLGTNANGDGSDIKWLLGADILVCGTFGGEFIIKGTGDAPITQSDHSARQKTNWGSERIQPSFLGSFANFIQRGGTTLRQLQYQDSIGTYKAVDISIFSGHYLESGVIAQAVQKNKDGILYLLTNEGKLVLVTLEQDQVVNAWSLWEDEPDVVIERMKIIPSYEGNYDELYMIVRRVINGETVRYIERMRDMITPENQQECWYLRSALEYDGYKQTKGIELDILPEYTQAATSEDVFKEEHIGRGIRAVSSSGEILGDADITKFINPRKVEIKINKDFKRNTHAGGTWAISVKEISGLEHLENKIIDLFADGAHIKARTGSKAVKDGKIELEIDCFKVLAGLPYTSYFAPLPIEVGAQNGTSVGKRKRVVEMAIRVWRTLGIRVGPDLKNLQQVQYREQQTPLGEPERLYTGLLDTVKFNGGWTWEAGFVIEQSNPLPMNVLAVAPIVNEVDK